MIKIFHEMAGYLNYPFVKYALITGILIALCSSLLGVTLVLKRYSFMGDGLSHVAFGAMAIAAVLSVTNEILVVMPLTILCAIFLLNGGQKARIKGDASLAMVSAGAMAMGYLLLNLFSTSPNISGDVCSTLFGSTSILTLSGADVWLCFILSILVMAVMLLFYNKIFAVTFDETFARAIGVNTGLYQLVMSVTTAVIIVLAMNLVGALLTSALIVFPALSAMRIFRSFRSVILCSGIFSVLAAGIGIFLSIPAGTPVGATVVIVNILGFLIFSLTGKLLKR